MAYNDEHIFQLILEKLSGEISDENRLYLEQAAREDDKIRRCLEEMEEASHVAGPEFMDDVYNEIAWSNVLSLLDGDQTAEKTGEVPAENKEKAQANIEKPQETKERTLLNKELVNTTGTGSARKNPILRWLVAAVTLVIISSLLYLFLSATNKHLSPIAKAKAEVTIPLSGYAYLLMDDGSTYPAPPYSEGNEVLLSEITGVKDEWATLVIPAGQVYKATLADGSKVQLNAYSSLRFPFRFTAKNREIYLSGEAYFSVVSHAAQPFLVHSGETVVKVLGTAFNINAYSDSLITTSLVQGSVLTSDNEQPEVQLQPGTEAIYRKGYLRQIHTFDTTTTLAWRKGQYNYDNESLGTLEPVIRHWYGKQLYFKDSALAAKKLTGIIERDKPLTDFLDGLGKTSGLAYQIKDDKIYLTEK
jgi:transmembrane sensor